MAVVAGVDFGTLSVRVSVVDSERGLLASALAEYPLHRKREDPEYATQSHEEHMRALAAATREVVRKSSVPAEQILAIALDTTGSSVVPVGENLQPLDEYYLWCDHRAKAEAAEITEAAHREKLAVIDWCGGVYSSEWGFSKLLHWLRRIVAKPMEKFRETPLRRIDAAAPVDGGEFFAVCGFGDFRSFGFGAVIAPQIIFIQRLEILAHRNDGRTCGVESNGKNLLGGDAGFPDDFASSGRQGAHVLFMRLRGVFGIFAFAMEGILCEGGSE